MKELLKKLWVKTKVAGHYVIDRLSEPSSWKGLSLIVSAGGWRLLDRTSKGELVAQAGLFLVGVIHVLFSQERQYGK